MRPPFLVAAFILVVASVAASPPEVVSVSATRVVIRQDGAIRSLPWAEVPPELRESLEPRRQAAVAEEAARAVRVEQEAARRLAERRVQVARAVGQVEEATAKFGQPVEWRTGVDLRSRFRELDLWVKAQGRRPSCSVFAVVGALEFQIATMAEKPVRLSEEYLLWATRQSLGQARRGGVGEGADADAGFALMEVVQALRTWGIPPAERVPNLVVGSLSRQEEPPAEVIAEARGALSVAAYQVPGRTPDDAVANLVHLLNGGVPVVIGLRWPPARALRRGILLRRQTPREGYSHAVTLVGYRASEEPGEVEFIFRNSWGPEWGAGGYGYVALSYLREHLLTAIFLDVGPGGRQSD